MIYAPLKDPEDWKQFLADPEKHWREGFSAHATAHAWHGARGFPPEVARVFEASSDFSAVEPLLILPEHKVPLPGGSRPSQTDVWILAKDAEGLISVAVEGKVAESFGPTVADWSTDASEGKSVRLSYLCGQLGLGDSCDGRVRYQLLHRTVSALIEARRFDASRAVMLVHSFSQSDEGYGDYRFFTEQLGTSGEVNEIIHIGERGGIELYLGWVRNPTR